MKEKFHIHLQEWIDLYCLPFYDQSIIITQRKTIRENPYLNQLLFDNLKALEKIFVIAKIPLLNGLDGFLLQMMNKDPEAAQKVIPKTKTFFNTNCAYRFFEALKHEEF